MSEDEINNIGDKPHSLKVSINAKGQWSAEIKCYGETPEEAMRVTLEKAKEIEIIIKEKNKIE